MELQKKTLYVCEEIGTITTAPYMTEAHFSTAMKYDVLYQKELPRFANTQAIFMRIRKAIRRAEFTEDLTDGGSMSTIRPSAV